MHLGPRFLLALLLTTFFTAQFRAQNPGCNGFRYKQPIFASVKKTSLPYSTAISQTGQAITLVMDVYEPLGDTVSKRPVVVLEHGGSFVFGDKTDMTRWCQLLAQRGYVAASIQYRLYPVFVLGFPDSVDVMDTAVKAVGDMKAAVRFFREDAATTNQFRADAEHIFIGGYSAGAVAALHAAYLDSTDVLPAFLQTIVNANGGFNGNSGSVSNQTYSSRALAVINMSGGLYRHEWINDGEMPMVSIHGTADGTVPFYSGLAANIAYLEGSGLLHPYAQQTGVWSYLKKVPGGGHTDIYDQAKYAPQLDNYWMRATALLEFLTCYIEDNAPHLVSGTESQPYSNALSEWSIAPNPLRGNTFQVQLPSALTSADLILFDGLGRIQMRMQAIQSGQFITFPGELPPGVYTIRIIDAIRPGLEIPARLLLRL